MPRFKAMVPFKKHFSLVRNEKPADHVDGGAFANSIGAHNAEDFALLDLKADIVYHGCVIILFGQFFTFRMFI